MLKTFSAACRLSTLAEEASVASLVVRKSPGNRFFQISSALFAESQTDAAAVKTPSMHGNAAGSTVDAPAAFDADVHLANVMPKTILSLEELGYETAVDSANGISFGATTTFPFLTPDGVARVNEELRRDAVQDACTFTGSPIAPHVMRGVTGKSSFLRDLWRSPRVADLISNIVGTPLVPHPMDMEVAHINVQATADVPVFSWHRDSQPLVIITMLSDPPEDAQGGKTLIRYKDGTEGGLDFPAAGYAYILQGSAIEHAASPALNYERWTMITSLMPASPWRVDGTDLQLAGTYSDADGLRRQFLRHKMATAVARLHDTMPRCAPGAALTDAFDDSSAVPAFETGTAVALLDQIIADLQHARDELAIARGDKTQSLG